MDHGFEAVQRTKVPNLSLEVIEFDHKPTGAKHIHLAANHPESAFMVALRTVPEDSTGVAHVLEHTTLCGSIKYPVRDPFFLMLRRSLNSFMNAFTAGDYTAYPFASISHKDFNNLLDVYLDAVFFPNLDPLDFAQEGHRLAFADPKDLFSSLIYKGVVYNEMKGDMSSPRAQLWESLNRALYPTATYRHNSGGDPAHIPDLTHEQLKSFHQRHYHPSNAIFMTFGTLDEQAFHAKLSSAVLTRFGAADEAVGVELERRYTAPIQVETLFPATEKEDDKGQAHLMMAWLLGESTNLRAQLEATLLSDVLLDHSGSPLRRVLESFPDAEAVSPLTGLEDSHREMSFRVGVEGASAGAMREFELAVLDVIDQVCEQGVPLDHLEGVLHQIELSQREIGGDGMPYGLQLMFTCLPSALHRGDPVGLLQLDAVLESLRQDIVDPQFIKDLARNLLKNNPHRVSLVMAPDPKMGAQQAADEQAKLDALSASFSMDDRQRLKAAGDALQRRQNEQDDLELLPKVTRADVPLARIYPEPEVLKDLIAYAAGCNGLVYHQWVRRMPSMTLEEWRLVPLLNQVFGELGFGDLTYEEAQLRQQQVTAGINAFISLRPDHQDPQRVRAYHAVSSRSLVKNKTSMMALVQNYFAELRFDEHHRITELLRQFSTRRQLGVVNQAHALAMLAATAAFSPAAALSHQLTGLGSLATLKQLVADCEQNGPEKVSNQLAALFDRIKREPATAVVIADERELQSLVSEIRSSGITTAIDLEPTLLPVALEVPNLAYVVDTQVNFCAAAYRCDNESSGDAAAIHVLAAVLRNQYLHSEVREKGGAYGAGASFDAAHGVFRMYSFRDPELLSTLRVFERALIAFNDLAVNEAMVEEAVLGLVSSIDAPGSPAGEARDDCYQRLQGRSPERRRALRQAIVEVTPMDVQRVAQRVLTGASSQVVVTDSIGAKSLPNSFTVRSI